MLGLRDILEAIVGGGAASKGTRAGLRAGAVGAGIGGAYGNSNIVNNAKFKRPIRQGSLPDSVYSRLEEMESKKFSKRPFKMYEDMSFQGSPSLNDRRNFNFYEDNSFAPRQNARDFPGIEPDYGIRLQGGFRGLQNGGGFDPMQSAARMQYGAQNQFYPGQNPLNNNTEDNFRLRVR